MREIVSGAKFNSFKQLVEHLEEVGKVLQDAGPKGESRSGCTAVESARVLEGVQLLVSSYLAHTELGCSALNELRQLIASLILQSWS